LIPGVAIVKSCHLLVANHIQTSNTLEAVVERFISAGGHVQSAEAFSELVGTLKKALAEDRFTEVDAALCSVITPGLDLTRMQVLGRIRQQLRGKSEPRQCRAKLAILGNLTTSQLAQLIDLHLFGAGVELECWEAEFGVFRQEIFESGSSLYQFAPRFVYVATSWRDLSKRPAPNAGKDDVARLVDTEYEEWATLWRTVHERSGCQIIQNNFVAPPWRLLGNYEMTHPSSLSNYIALMNKVLVERAPPYVTVHDVDHLAASWGRWLWSDPRFVFHAKLPCAPQALVDYAHSVASLISANLGLAKKCLVLDLDNTLWGGVVGDDGLSGIRLGQGDAEGEAFIAFQEYVKGLQQRGVLLAVCSKNDAQIAREVFQMHPSMILRLDDISCFLANWQDKVENLRCIARELNISLNSLVFLDDHPAERAMVRRLAPAVAAPELPDDPAGFPQVLEQYRFFQMTGLVEEDLRRTDYYRANEQRRGMETSAADVESFLQSLKMKGRIDPINSLSLERSVQLIHRSNQFNLTTRRRSSAEILKIISDPSWITRTVSLADRFGDNGLISVVLAQAINEGLYIDTWLMSCRTLKRGVERLLLNNLCRVARSRGLTTLFGEYFPSEKNKLVRNHYSQLGFTLVEENPSGQTRWRLILDGDCNELPHFINEEESDG
jgi:FkbH-like protein